MSTKIFPKSLMLAFVLLQFLYAENDFKIMHYATGGAGGIANIGGNVNLGVVVGQGYASSNDVFYNDVDVPLDGNSGFWIEVESVSSSAPIKQTSVDLKSKNIEVLFGKKAARVTFSLSKSTLTRISLVDLSGRTIMPTQVEKMPSGASTLLVPLEMEPTGAYYLVIETDAVKHVYRYIAK